MDTDKDQSGEDEDGMGKDGEQPRVDSQEVTQLPKNTHGVEKMGLKWTKMLNKRAQTKKTEIRKCWLRPQKIVHEVAVPVFNQREKEIQLRKRIINIKPRLLSHLQDLATRNINR